MSGGGAWRRKAAAGVRKWSIPGGAGRARAIGSWSAIYSARDALSCSSPQLPCSGRSIARRAAAGAELPPQPPPFAAPLAGPVMQHT